MTVVYALLGALPWLSAGHGRALVWSRSSSTFGDRTTPLGRGARRSARSWTSSSSPIFAALGSPGDVAPQRRRLPTCPSTPDAARPPRPHGRRIRPHRRHPRPRAEPDRARHLLGDVVRALQLQELARPPAHAAHPRAARAAGPGRERRRRGHRRRLAAVLQDREPQPPVVHRAVSRARRPAWAASSATSSPWARGPIALLDSLRFGDARRAANRGASSTGVVAGIGGYGNCIGIPTVGGEVVLRRPLRGQPPGQRVLPRHRASTTAIFRARAEGVGNPVFYVGAKTGRDGIHGATMASAEFDETSEEKRPDRAGGRSVHGEAAARGVPRGHGDRRDRRHPGHGRGRARPARPARWRARGGTGIEIDLDRVPQRETGMTPYEIMLSESQERMLLVVERGREDEVEAHLREVGPRRRRDRRRSPTTACCGCASTATVVADVPANAPSPTRRPSTSGPPRGPPGWTSRSSFDPASLCPTPPTAEALLTPARPRRTSPASAGSTASTTTWCGTNTARAARAGTPACVRVKGTRSGARADRRLQRALRASSIRAAARSWRWPRRRATSPAPARAARR